MTADGRHTLELLLVVGAGVGEGEFVNRAQAMNRATGAAMSFEATATVRIVPDVDFDCTDVIGMFFDDANRNGLKDLDEAGISGLRVEGLHHAAVSLVAGFAARWARRDEVEKPRTRAAAHWGTRCIVAPEHDG